ncbi:unnamed protein product [Amoebophrya sp. A25]|nr:unnamed protein product [Amoebophrya sp. A25]|eukprot:GSA25T00015251001.1
MHLWDGRLVPQFLRFLKQGVWTPAPGGPREGTLVERLGDENGAAQNASEYYRWLISGKSFPRKRGKAFFLEHFEFANIGAWDPKKFRPTFPQAESDGEAAGLLKDDVEQALLLEGEDEKSNDERISYQYVSNLRQCAAQVVSSYRQMTRNQADTGRGFHDVLENQKDMDLGSEVYPMSYRHMFPSLDDAFFLSGHDLINTAMHQEFLKLDLKAAASPSQNADFDKAVEDVRSAYRLPIESVGSLYAETTTRPAKLTVPAEDEQKQAETLAGLTGKIALSSFFVGANIHPGPAPLTMMDQVAQALHGENVALSPLRESTRGVDVMEAAIERDAELWSEPSIAIKTGARAVREIAARRYDVRTDDTLGLLQGREPSALVNGNANTLTSEYEKRNDNADERSSVISAASASHHQMLAMRPDVDRYEATERTSTDAWVDLHMAQKSYGIAFPQHLIHMHEGAARSPCVRNRFGLQMFGCTTDGNKTWFNASFHGEPSNLLTDVATQFRKFSLQTNLLAGRTKEVFEKNEHERAMVSEARLSEDPNGSSDEAHVIGTSSRAEESSATLRQKRTGSLTIRSEVHDTFGKGYSHFRSLSDEEDMKTFEAAARRILHTAFGGFALVGVLDRYKEFMELLECVFPTFFSKGTETLEAGRLAKNAFGGGDGEYFAHRGIVAKKDETENLSQAVGVLEQGRGEQDDQDPTENIALGAEALGASREKTLTLEQKDGGLWSRARERRKSYREAVFLLDFAFGQRTSMGTLFALLNAARDILTKAIKSGVEKGPDEKALARVGRLKKKLASLVAVDSSSSFNRTLLLNTRMELVAIWRLVHDKVLLLGPHLPVARVRTVDGSSFRYVKDLAKHKAAQEKSVSRFLKGLFGSWCQGSADDLLYRIARKRFSDLVAQVRSQAPGGDIRQSACCRARPTFPSL